MQPVYVNVADVALSRNSSSPTNVCPPNGAQMSPDPVAAHVLEQQHLRTRTETVSQTHDALHQPTVASIVALYSRAPPAASRPVHGCVVVPVSAAKREGIFPQITEATRRRPLAVVGQGKLTPKVPSRPPKTPQHIIVHQPKLKKKEPPKGFFDDVRTELTKIELTNCPTQAEGHLTDLPDKLRDRLQNVLQKQQLSQTLPPALDMAPNDKDHTDFHVQSIQELKARHRGLPSGARARMRTTSKQRVASSHCFGEMVEYVPPPEPRCPEPRKTHVFKTLKELGAFHGRSALSEEDDEVEKLIRAAAQKKTR